MADPLQGSQLTDMWMVDPTMFDPTQKSNQFSLYNNARIPFPPTYNDQAGGPVNAATGQPIASYQQWKQQNPGGVTLNNTPAQPPPAPAPSGDPMMNQIAGWQALTQPEMAQRGNTYGDPYLNAIAPGGNPMTNSVLQGAYSGKFGLAPSTPGQGQQGAGGAAQGAVQGQGAGQGGSPNNWYAALNALSNPGTPAIQGATVPIQTGYQPAGGVNQAFLNQAGGGAGMNQNFLGALRAIQGR